MERSDLSLIEISGENDSLLSLQHSPNVANNDDVSSLNGNNETYFSCSPLLQLPRSNRFPPRPPRHPLLASPIGIMEDDMGKPSSSSHKDSRTDSINKENVNMNKSEVPKLNVEPQQMKRKKKGGGYNLRKSLAWDRAFFTEEGVLDPSELSMLSGNVDKSSRGTLSVIHEGRESLSSGLDSAGDSPDWQALEDNLFKELPASTLNDSRKIAGLLSPKPGSSVRDEVGSASAAKRKVLSAHDINRSASKRSGCLRPVASSSLKRPPIVNKTKAATKDSKVAKPLAPKPDPSVVSTTSRSSINHASHLKRNPIAQPVVNAQKSIGLKGTSINTKNVPKNDMKSVPAGKSITKSTVQHGRRNVVSSVAERRSLTNIQCSQVSQANNTLEVVPDPVRKVTAHAPNGNVGSTGKIAASFSQYACHNGGNMQYAQPQIAKPSGLRMPSPSLGFFGQSKPSGSHSLLQRRTKPGSLPESSVPNLCKIGALNSIHQRAPQPLGKMPALSSTGCSASSIVNPSSHGQVKSDLALDNMQKVEVQVSHNSKTSDTINYQRQLPSIRNVDLQSLDRAKPSAIEKISHVEDIGLQRNDNTLLSQGSPCEQLKDIDSERLSDICPKSRDLTGTGLDYSHFMIHLRPPVEVRGLSKTDSMISSQHVVDRQYNPSIKNHSVCLDSQSVEMGNNSDEGTSKVHKDQLSSMHEVQKQSREQAELTNSDTCEVDPVSHIESQRLSINKGTLFEGNQSSEELNKYKSLNAADASLNTADASLKVQDSASELETSYGLSQSKDVGHPKDGTDGIDNLSRELHVGDAQLQSVNSNLLAEIAKSTLRPAMDNPPLMVIHNLSEKYAEHAELPSPSLVTEQAFEDDFGLQFNDCLLHGKKFSSEESQEDNALQSIKTVAAKRTDACKDVLKNSSVLSSIPHCKQDYGFEVTGKVECLSVENALTASVYGEAVLKNFKHDLELHSEASSLELERMGKGHVIDAPAICPAGVADFCGHTGDWGGNELENPQVTSQSPLVQVKVASGEQDMSENKGIVDKQHDSLVKNCIEFSDLQSGSDNCHNERGSSIMRNDCSSGTHDVNEQSLEQAMLISSSSGEADWMSRIQEADDDLVLNESRSFGDSQKFINENIADVDATCGAGSGSLQGLCQYETPMEDAQVQSLDGSLLVDSCNSNISTSVENEKLSMMVDDITEQPEEHPELQNPDLEQVPLENHGLFSGDNLLLMNMFSVETQKRDAFGNVLGVVFEQFDGCPSTSKNFEICFQVPTVMQDVGLHADEKAEHLSMDDAMSGAIEIEPSVENIECYMDYKYVNNDELGDGAALEFDLCSKKSGGQIPLAANTCNSNPFFSSGEKSRILQKTNETSSESILQDIEVNLSQNNILPGEAEIDIPQNNNSLNGESESQLDNVMYLTEDKDALLSHEKSVNGNKQDALVLKPPPNAIPFSDEWLAAFEAAGEEILTMKGGTVQNSPPDKSLPEPSPWSPVRRKNNQGIGPFDCTKFTNTNTPSSTCD